MFLLIKVNDDRLLKKILEMRGAVGAVVFCNYFTGK